MDALSQSEIDRAEAVATPHSHVGLSSADESLLTHIREAHHLAADPGLSSTTVEGLHDRMHSESHAADT